jgi:hypothetical protein
MPLSDHISEPFLALVGVLKLFVCCRILQNIPTVFCFALLILLVYVVKLKISKIESQKVGDITKLWKLESCTTLPSLSALARADFKHLECSKLSCDFPFL